MPNNDCHPLLGPPAMLESLAGPREGDKYNGYTGQGELQGALKELGYTAEQVCLFLFRNDVFC